jgi:hypothetical protein
LKFKSEKKNNNKILIGAVRKRKAGGEINLCARREIKGKGYPPSNEVRRRSEQRGGSSTTRQVAKYHFALDLLYKTSSIKD